MNYPVLKVPPNREQLNALTMGSWLGLSGQLFTARDTALKQLCSLIQAGAALPIELNQAMIYFMGPTPAALGEALGAAGPTTSRRMEPYIPQLLQAGVKGVIGKGPLSAEMVSLFRQHQAVYLAAAGGAGAVYGARVVKANLVAYPDLGPEAIYSLQVERFPVVVAIDVQGRNLFDHGSPMKRED